MSHFPDGVDVVLVDKPFVEEMALDTPEEAVWLEKSQVEDGPIMKTIRIDLNELEPETGIWAGISMASRRVYVCIKREYYDP
jgi:hypothetical protein